jgi:hypothetical protein
MTGVALWTIIGQIAAILGIWLAVGAVRVGQP